MARTRIYTCIDNRVSQNIACHADLYALYISIYMVFYSFWHWHCWRAATIIVYLLPVYSAVLHRTSSIRLMYEYTQWLAGCSVYTFFPSVCSLADKQFGALHAHIPHPPSYYFIFCFVCLLFLLHSGVEICYVSVRLSSFIAKCPWRFTTQAGIDAPPKSITNVNGIHRTNIHAQISYSQRIYVAYS